MKTHIDGISVFNIMAEGNRNGNHKEEANQEPRRSDGDMDVSITELPTKENSRQDKDWQENI